MQASLYGFLRVYTTRGGKLRERIGEEPKIGLQGKSPDVDEEENELKRGVWPQFYASSVAQLLAGWMLVLDKVVSGRFYSDKICRTGRNLSCEDVRQSG